MQRFLLAFLGIYLVKLPTTGLGESARFHLFDCRVTRVHPNRKANSGLKTIVREAGLPGRRAGRVSRDRRPKVIR